MVMAMKDSAKIVVENVTLRDLFAISALQGFATLYSIVQGDVPLPKEDTIAVKAYELADAMLRAREGGYA
jgi:hypothetical protein